MKPYYHSLLSAKKFGGTPEDYLEIHRWFDKSKAGLADVRHRAVRHHSEGIFWCEEVFGSILTNSEGKKIPVRNIGEQHVLDDLGWIPTLKDWLQNMKVDSWMLKANKESIKQVVLID